MLALVDSILALTKRATPKKGAKGEDPKLVDAPDPAGGEDADDEGDE